MSGNIGAYGQDIDPQYALTTEDLESAYMVLGTDEDDREAEWDVECREAELAERSPYEEVEEAQSEECYWDPVDQAWYRWDGADIDNNGPDDEYDIQDQPFDPSRASVFMKIELYMKGNNDRPNTVLIGYENVPVESEYESTGPMAASLMDIYQLLKSRQPYSVVGVHSYGVELPGSDTYVSPMPACPDVPF